MHPLTETYLNRIETRLKRLAPDEREKQIEEIALHLQALIVDNQVQGMSERDAIEAALTQFGKPAKIGRAIEQQIVVGHKTSIAKGIFIGAIAGEAALFCFWSLFLLQTGTINSGNAGLGSLSEKLTEAAFAGAVASLVGRRFTWRYLSRPSRHWSLFSRSWHMGIVAFRTMGAGMLRGAVGGATFGFVSSIMALSDLHCTVTLMREMILYLVVLSVGSALTISLLTGFLGAILGVLRCIFGYRSTTQRA